MNAARDTALKLMLSPVLLAQAIWVRQVALNLPEPAGPRNGTRGSGPRLRILIAGDSSAAGVGAATQDEALSGQIVAQLSPRFQVEWQLEAHTGATTRSILAQLSAMPPRAFDIAVTSLGVNDVTRNVPLTRWIDQQATLHALLREKFGVTRVLVSGLPPMEHFPLLPNPLRWVLGRQAHLLDSNLGRLCADDPCCTHLPFDMPFDPAMMARDGFHPAPAAYTEWARRIGLAVPDA